MDRIIQTLCRTLFQRERMCSRFLHSFRENSVNIVRESCEAYADIRSMPGLSANDVRDMIERCLSPLDLAHELQEEVFVPAVETHRSALIVKTLARSIE
jgi:acetylornithine deacetylase/succinyl-diaminopimelate desuccinylase-like protein